jgi:predicted RNase H-like HicB family nuclease
MSNKLTKYNLLINVLKQGKFFVAYCPALDLSTCGKTHKQALKMINEAIQIFFEELESMGTTKKVLSSLGWQTKNQITPPSVESVNIPFSYAKNSEFAI